MYPNSALSAGTMAIIAVVVALSLVAWIGSVFLAAREPRHRAAGSNTASLPQRPSADMEEPQRKAA